MAGGHALLGRSQVPLELQSSELRSEEAPVAAKNTTLFSGTTHFEKSKEKWN